jgi:hypothetical protein
MRCHRQTPRRRAGVWLWTLHRARAHGALVRRWNRLQETSMTTIQVLDPAGAVQPRAALQLTAIASLAGRRVAVLDNAKPNFQRLATLAAERLCAEQGMTGVAHFRKENPSVGAEQALLDEIARRADLVLTGSAD